MKRPLPLLSLLLMVILPGCTRPNDASAMLPAAPEPTAAAPATQPAHAVLPDGFTVGLELAVTPEERQNGLMFRPSLPNDHGMLFLFEHPARITIWMKNTFVPLDIVFLDARGQVVDISRNALPCKAEPCAHYLPAEPASAVLELAAGMAEAHDLEKGVRIRFSNVDGYPLEKVGE